MSAWSDRRGVQVRAVGTEHWTARNVAALADVSAFDSLAACRRSAAASAPKASSETQALIEAALMEAD